MFRIKLNKVAISLVIGFVLLTVQLPHAYGSPLTVADWKHLIDITPAPGWGCFTSSYPDVVWSKASCANNPLARPMTVGNGNDWAGQIGCCYHLSNVQGSFTAESGYQSESDSIYGSGWYSLQVNTNTYGIVFNGRATTGWTQFVYVNECCGLTGDGLLYIQWWLIGYGACPGGWASYGNSCYMNSPESFLGHAEDPSMLYAQSLSGSASATQDQATFCFSTICHSASGGDTTFLSQNHWTQAEWNVFGVCCSSRANFNSGFSLTAALSAGIPDYESFAACVNTGFTGETNNLNLGSCSAPYQWEIQFSENNVPPPPPRCPPICAPAIAQRTT